MQTIKRAITGDWFFGLLMLAVVAAWQVSMSAETLANPILAAQSAGL